MIALDGKHPLGTVLLADLQTKDGTIEMTQVRVTGHGTNEAGDLVSHAVYHFPEQDEGIFWPCDVCGGFCEAGMFGECRAGLSSTEETP